MVGETMSGAVKIRVKIDQTMRNGKLVHLLTAKQEPFDDVMEVAAPCRPAVAVSARQNAASTQTSVAELLRAGSSITRNFLSEVVTARTGGGHSKSGALFTSGASSGKPAETGRFVDDTCVLDGDKCFDWNSDSEAPWLLEVPPLERACDPILMSVCSDEDAEERSREEEAAVIAAAAAADDGVDGDKEERVGRGRRLGGGSRSSTRRRRPRGEACVSSVGDFGFDMVAADMELIGSVLSAGCDVRDEEGNSTGRWRCRVRLVLARCLPFPSSASFIHSPSPKSFSCIVATPTPNHTH